MRNLLAQKGPYRLFGPKNTQDTNYHLVDEDEGKDYFIDLEDVYSHEGAAKKHSGILYADMVKLEDIDAIKEFAWKVGTINREVF